jgi:hypothetical protein
MLLALPDLDVKRPALGVVLEAGHRVPPSEHTQPHAISFFVIPEALVTTTAIAWMIVWSVSVLLIYAFRKRLFGPSDAA